MSIGAIFITSFFVALSGALMPGPLLTVTIAYSLKKGFWAGPLVILGHMVLEIVLLLGIIFGMGQFLQNDLLIRIIFLAGGMILITMGYHFIKTFKKTNLKKDGSSRVKIAGHPVIGGILVSLSNPYWTIWWVTIGLAYVMKSIPYKFWGVSAFFSGHILADLLWYSLVSFFFGKGKQFVSEKIYHMILLGCGIFLALFGIYFFISGIRH
ncbi:MAG: LysE family transporter [Spirochaetes bacterium]|nr:LysE family transporter [Spirochaetota bacterium]